jgi:hypothetical protein
MEQAIVYLKRQIHLIWCVLNKAIDSNGAYSPPLLTNGDANNNSLYYNSSNQLIYKKADGTTLTIGTGGGGGGTDLSTLSTYVDDAAAATGGLAVGSFYVVDAGNDAIPAGLVKKRLV